MYFSCKSCKEISIITHFITPGHPSTADREFFASQNSRFGLSSVGARDGEPVATQMLLDSSYRNPCALAMQIGFGSSTPEHCMFSISRFFSPSKHHEDVHRLRKRVGNLQPGPGLTFQWNLPLGRTGLAGTLFGDACWNTASTGTCFSGWWQSPSCFH